MSFAKSLAVAAVVVSLAGMANIASAQDEPANTTTDSQTTTEQTQTTTRYEATERDSSKDDKAAKLDKTFATQRQKDITTSAGYSVPQVPDYSTTSFPR